MMITGNDGWKKRFAGILLSAVAAAVIGAAALVPALAREETPPVSPALYVLSRQLGFDKSGLKGFTITFEPSDFEEALGVGRLEEIVIRELPSRSAGKLMLGALEVMKNQTVSRANIGALRFVPNGAAVSGASFRFEAGNAAVYSVTCSLHLLDEPNAAPAGGGTFTVTAFKNIAVYGTLPASDPEGDALTFAVTESPRQGLLTLTDRASGAFIYTPVKNFVGKDGFSYTVTDEYGNRSETVSVSVEVTRSESGTVFEDLIGDPVHYDAIRLFDRGIMNGVKVGQSYRFEPEKTVSRADFLVMAMKAAGITAAGEGVKSVFYDDAAIPDAARAYVAAAFERGYIEGIERDGLPLFEPDGTVTRSEACVTIGRILGIFDGKSRPVSGTEEERPDESAAAAAALTEAGILPKADGAVPDEPLTRSEAATLLAGMLDYRSHKE